VSDFETGDVTLSGTAGATTAIVTGGPTSYNIAVSGMTVSGTVIASIEAGKAHDTAGNASASSTSADNEVSYLFISVVDATVSDVKMKPENGTAQLLDKLVTAVLTDRFYIEETDKSSGIMVIPTSMPPLLAIGDKVDVLGDVRTNAQDERYINGISVTRNPE